MKFVDYAKDNFVKAVVYLVGGALIISVLMAFHIDSSAVMCVLGILVVFGVVLFLYDYWRKRRFYENMAGLLESLDKKYLLSEMLEVPNFFEGKVFYDVLRDTNKATAEEISRYRRQVENFRDYIELWVHEIKTPLAGLGLALRHEDRAVKIYLEEMGNYVDQVLFYSKIDDAEKDYVIKRTSLEKVVNDVIRRNKDNLINNDVRVETAGLGRYVFSDVKWLEFIINQIVSNAIKYRRKKPVLRISADKSKAGVVLVIYDNGMGVKKSELKRVFDKGFTGSNDRKTKASTGMGLYISSELARGLGHNISIESEAGKYTKVQIVFGDNDFYLTKT